MSRYIEVNKAMDLCTEFFFSEETCSVENLFNSAPSIDICFCRDCKKRDDDYVCYKWASVDECPQVRPDDFCSYGEREGE